jgi:type II secretory pathway pseudopilin PulG
MRNRRTGFLMAEALTAIILLGMMAALLFYSVHQARRGMRRVADFRAATRLAEATLLALRSGQARLAAGGPSVSIQTMPDSQPQARTVWVRVRAEIDGHPAELIGAVPRSALAGPADGAAR